MDSNLAREFVRKNRTKIICEPSGKRYSELTREWNLIRELLKSK